MGSKIKEDERTEKAIRSLLKLPENRRCINCNSLGPQYVCSTFWTFVCINCSGIHREFTHRVKSISMAKFTAEEVSALRAGGNERARQFYFKEWDTKRDTYPDASNIFKLRDFIRSVYVDKRYSNESKDKMSQQKPAVTEDNRESKKASVNFLGSRSFHSIDKPETERASAGGKTGNKSLKFYFEDMEPKQQQQQHVTHNPKSRGLPKSPIRFEIVDDRYRDDGSVKRYDARREPRGSSKSLDLSNNKETSGLPIVRHASELIGENHPRLRVEKVVTVENKNDPVNNQVAASSNKMESPGSLIDDVPVSEPSDDSITHTSNEKKTEGPAPNSLEALLFGFSDPSEENHPAANLEIQAMPRTQDSDDSFVTAPTITHAGSLELAVLPAADNLNTKDMVTTSESGNNQVESSTPTKEPSVTSMEQSTLAISNYAHGDHQEETKSSVRSALPEDLFTGGFSFASPQVHAQHHGMGYGMQYYQYPVATGAFPHTAKPANPFDISYDDDTCPHQTPQYPYVQGGGLPLVSVPRGASDSFGLMMASQSPYYAPALSPTSPSHASNLSPGAYAGQQSHVNMPPSFRRQEMNSMANAETTYNGAYSYQQADVNGYPSANPNAYISRGNPFD